MAADDSMKITSPQTSPTTTTNLPSVALTDVEAIPDQFAPVLDEIQEDELHQVLAANATTCSRVLRPRRQVSRTAKDTVSIPYADQLCELSPPIEESQSSSNGGEDVLKSVKVSASLEALRKLNSPISKAMDTFFKEFETQGVHRVSLLHDGTAEQHDCTYIDIVVNKVHVRAILDSGAPSNIISSKFVKRLKLAPDLDYQQEFGTAGPNTTRAKGAYSSLPLKFGRLIVTAPAIVLDNNSYDILIGTSFMHKYGTIMDHAAGIFKILGHSIPMYYNKMSVTKESTRKVHHIALEYNDGDLPVAYTLRQRKLKQLPTSVKEYSGIPLYASSRFTIPPGAQVIHNVGLQLELPNELHGEVIAASNLSPLEPSIAPGILFPSRDEIQVLLANLTATEIWVNKHQLLGYVRLEENQQLRALVPIAGLDEFGLPSEQTSVLTIIPREELSGLSEEQKDRALALFEKYRAAFAENDLDLGKAIGVEHRLDVQGHAPIRSRPIRRSQANIAIVNEELQKLLSNGLIIPSKSPWASPLLIVKKKDGSNRVVIDYRRLNLVTKKDSYPLPRIDDTLDKLGGAKYFSAMDLISGYWQIDLPAADQEKCAIITENGLFQPTRMPQGLSNAPATFQRAMDTVIGDLKLLCVLVYLDDINVFSRTFDEHLLHLEAVFCRLISANLKLKPRKCNFFKEHLEFLGYKISKEGLSPVPAKVEAIEKMQTPANKRDVQVFLGMIGYYRRFIPGFASIGDPLFHLLKGEVPFNWSSSCQEAFDTFKKCLISLPLLSYPDFSKPFTVHTDASLTAIGGVLSQFDSEGLEHPVGYCSRTLNRHERNYTVTERECLAVIYSYQQFRTYLHGVKFTVVTDHASLQWLKTLKDPEGRLARWAIKLQAFDYEIKHRAGSTHQNADCLSRLPTIALVSPRADELYDKLLLDSSLWGEEPSEVLSALKRFSKDTKVMKGQLFKLIDNKWLPYIRPSLRTDAIVSAHKAIGHGGIQKTINMLQQHCYWEGLHSDVVETLLACHDCNLEKPRVSRYQHRLIRPGFAFHTVAIDVVGPLPTTASKNKYIIVAIDHLTKWVEAKAIPNQSALTTATFILENIIYRHGCPQTLLTDNGTNFTSYIIPRLNSLMGIKGTLTTPYRPQANGMVERTNGSLVSILRKLAHTKETEWDTFLPAAIFAYNIGFNRSTGHTPFRLIYGRHPSVPPALYSLVCPEPAISQEAYLQRLTQSLVKIQSEAYSTNLSSKEKDIERANNSRPPLPKFEVGDSVYFYSKGSFKRDSKLAALWQGPAKVVQQVGPDSYTLKEPTQGQLISQVHAQYMRRAPRNE